MGILSFMKPSAEMEIDFAEETRRFFSIQISRYLSRRQSGHFSGTAEEDAILAMIKDSWVELRYSGALYGLSRKGRDALYVTTIIVFPGFVADCGLRCIPVDFVTGRRLSNQITGAPSGPTLSR